MTFFLGIMTKCSQIRGGEGVWGSYTSKNVFLATNDKKKQFFSLKKVSTILDTEESIFNTMKTFEISAFKIIDVLRLARSEISKDKKDHLDEYT